MGRDQRQLSVDEAYMAMFRFLEAYYEGGHSEEIAGLLGGLAMSSDGRPMDQAFWDDWLDAVARALATDREPRGE